MDLARQYIIQCIAAAANNLRLSSEKIETVAIIRERLNNAENLFDEIKGFITNSKINNSQLFEIQENLELVYDETCSLTITLNEVKDSTDEVKKSTNDIKVSITEFKDSITEIKNSITEIKNSINELIFEFKNNR